MLGLVVILKFYIKHLKRKIMGKYVNETTSNGIGTSFHDKCKALILDGAEEIECPTKFQDNLVCVVENGWFGAAAFVYNERELQAFKLPNDLRIKRWFIWEKVELYAL